MKFKRKHLGVLGAVAVVGVAYAATVITLDNEISLSDGGNGHKPKLSRTADGTLVSVFGDSRTDIAFNESTGTGYYYDPKADTYSKARELVVKWCNPNTTDCNTPTHWTAATTHAYNEDGTATGTQRTDGFLTYATHLSSVSTAWKGGDPVADQLPVPGNAEKPNIKQSGSVMVVTWISQYCPDGDLRTPGVQGSAQRSIRYLERGSKVVPFACTWTAWSPNNGKNWSIPKQLSNGERDAKQDASGGTFDAATGVASIAVSWQEDPEGLQLGEADGPGDGASGAKTTGGTDIWYTHATIHAATAATAPRVATFAAPSPHVSTTADARDGDGTERALGYRISDNWELEKKYGLDGQITNVLVNGAALDGKLVEKGSASAARANIGMVGKSTVLAWEETKGGGSLTSGKFIRYRTFPYNQPPVISSPATASVAMAPYANEKSACVISQVNKSAKRVRFLTQSAADATGAVAPAVPDRSGINIAIFWREGETDNGGPSDIIIRRGMVNPTAASNLQSGLVASRMLPAVDADCATSDYSALVTNVTHAPGENLSSRASMVTATDAGLTDDTELNSLENALAHRGVLRGDDLWVGYNYVSDLSQLNALNDVYDFWIRKFEYDPTTGGAWNQPRNVTNIKTTAVNPNNLSINVREPRIFGTPASNTNAGFCDNADPTLATDKTFCQNRNVVYLLWGSQQNCALSDTDCGKDQGVYGTVSFDGGVTYATPVRISAELGSVFDDDDSAFETQPQTRPDGTKFYTVFNTENEVNGLSAANYVSGTVAQVDDPVDPPVTSSGGGGCTAADGQRPLDPMLPLLAALGLLGWGLRRARRH